MQSISIEEYESNDEYNFFFLWTDCERYRVIDYVSQPNYSLEEAEKFIQTVNTKYTPNIKYLHIYGLLWCFFPDCGLMSLRNDTLNMI